MKKVDTPPDAYLATKVGAASVGFIRFTEIDLDVLRSMVERAHALLGPPI